MKHNEAKEFKTNDLKTLVNVGFVARLPLESIPQLKAFLLELPDCSVIYQHASVGKLWIKEE